MNENITAVILCGGKAQRMNGADKGLQLLMQKPLYQWVYQAIAPQVSEVIINANRSIEQYAKSQLPVITDQLTGFLGPLSGMLTGLQHAKSDWVLFVPCDTPYLPVNLVEKLAAARLTNTQVVYATDGKREHPTCCLLHRSLIPALSTYLQQGHRRVLGFLQQQAYQTANFADQKNSFININSVDELNFYCNKKEK
ncbi:molybdenum cofactor guanylyltransferase MobA [Gallibacterium salpingitidis]|uniref:molybdenum cofactor guanylyltransferase MobA n=1 Tax=Gallibacterium salpingitidis TaxID=505341 RepID=UPI00266FF372|nr:molybdenum cofactor guanylyltransferase MobA [Gallibacterium salpingitidis]WKT00087.1 molybdenum cofactor guanylyltransferase MobA [Gallibacterium salpingitidis]